MAFTSTNTWSPGDEVTSDDLNDLDSKTVMAVDGVGGGTYAAPIGFTNLIALTCNGVATFNENVTIDTAILYLSAASGLGVLGGATVTWANTALASFQSGSSLSFGAGTTTATYNNGHTGTYTAGATLAMYGLMQHFSGSNDIYVSGSQTTYNTGALIELNGYLTVTTNGTVSYSAGAATLYYNTPEFNDGFDLIGGTASFALGTLVRFNSLNTSLIGPTNRLKFTSRTIFRKVSTLKAQADIFYHSGGGLYTPERHFDTNFINLNDVGGTFTAAQSLSLDIDPPNGSTLTSVSINWSGSGTLTWAVYENSTSLAGETTTTTGGRTLTMGQTVDRENNTYRIVFQKPVGTSENKSWTSAKYGCTVSEYEEGGN